MKAVSSLSFLVFGLFSAPFAYAADVRAPFVGVWEYRQRAGEGYDDEGEKLELKRAGNSIRGTYFGLEREGEHGLFYTLVKIKEVKVTDGELSFVVPARELYAERPRSWEHLKSLKQAGATKDELVMRGRRKGGTLLLHCTSRDGRCPDRVMEFRRNGWK